MLFFVRALTIAPTCHVRNSFGAVRCGVGAFGLGDVGGWGGRREMGREVGSVSSESSVLRATLYARTMRLSLVPCCD